MEKLFRFHCPVCESRLEAKKGEDGKVHIAAVEVKKVKAPEDEADDFFNFTAQPEGDDDEE